MCHLEGNPEESHGRETRDNGECKWVLSPRPLPGFTGSNGERKISMKEQMQSDPRSTRYQEMERPGSGRELPLRAL